MIKLTKILFALSLLLFVTACGSDDDGPDTNDLLGTWVAVSFEGDIESTSEFSGTTTTSEINFIGSNIDYRLTFTENAWTTAGGYDATVTSTVNGMSGGAIPSSQTGVSGSGNYSINGNVMTIDGSFFELTSNGVPVTAIGEAQMADFEINSDGELVFTQDEVIESTDSGVTSTSTVKSNSVWRRE